MSAPLSSLLIVGYGKMGSALLQGLLSAKTPALSSGNIHVIEPSGREMPASVNAYASLGDLPTAFAPDVALFAVKPQTLAELLPEYRRAFGAKPLYISIAAGKDTKWIGGQLGGDARIVRAMPNTPALIGQGMTALYATANIHGHEKRMAAELFEAVGRVVWLADEVQMHAVTALSGCGPAYVFLFLEALISAAVALGLPPDLARDLALQTVAGSAVLALHSQDESLERQRDRVASPGGSTEAALKTLLEDGAFRTLIGKALAAAAERSKALAA